MSLLVEHVHKSFGPVQAITDLSLEVKEGALFGFLGLNGAGKTTSLRLILDIFHPDAGQITWNGRPVSQVARRNWGYLPEARGLYPAMEVEEQLVFLARLNGLSGSEARTALNTWFERFKIQGDRKKRFDALSIGTQQKIQFIAAILHDPAVLVLDEPFNGLDPLAIGALKDVIIDLRRRGKTIILSTHRTDQVEELCEDVLLFNQGRLALLGSVSEIKRQYGRSLARLKIDNDPKLEWLDWMTGVKVVKRRRDYVELALSAGFNPNQIVEVALSRGAQISRFERVESSLSDIFIERVGAISVDNAAMADGAGQPDNPPPPEAPPDALSG